MVIRTATLRIVAKDFGGVRAAVEAVVAQAGGFIDQMTVTGDNATARVLRGTAAGARRPHGRRTLTRLRAARPGRRGHAGIAGRDRSDRGPGRAPAPAPARPRQRLTELLANRTGKLSDVLEVERELTRVRLDIERLVAEKTNIGRRVSYATIDVTITEERKAGLDRPALARDSHPHRRRRRPRGGARYRRRELLFVLRAGPTLLACWGAWWSASRLARSLFRLKAETTGSDEEAEAERWKLKAGAESRKLAAGSYGFTDTHGFGMKSCS